MIGEWLLRFRPKHWEKLVNHAFPERWTIAVACPCRIHAGPVVPEIAIVASMATTIAESFIFPMISKVFGKPSRLRSRCNRLLEGILQFSFVFPLFLRFPGVPVAAVTPRPICCTFGQQRKLFSCYIRWKVLTFQRDPRQVAKKKRNLRAKQKRSKNIGKTKGFEQSGLGHKKRKSRNLTVSRKPW